MDVNILMYRLVEFTFFAVFVVCLRDAWRRGRQGDAEIERIEEELAQEKPGSPREHWKAPNYLWVGVMLAAMAFTFAFEYVLTHKRAPAQEAIPATATTEAVPAVPEGPPGSDSIYSYEVPALINLGGVTLPDGSEKAGSAVPLWIPCGWALIIYLVMRTSDKLNLRWYKRPVLDGLMALVIDFALDPVASWNHWWVWDFSLKPDLKPTLFFNIPATNYMAWIVIVGAFSFFVRVLQRWRMGRFETRFGAAVSTLMRKWPQGWFGDLVLPLVATVPSFFMVIGYSLIGRRLMDTTNTAWYADQWFSNGALLCSVVWGACLVWCYLDAPIARRDHKHDYVLMFSPLTLYAVILAAVYTTRVPANDAPAFAGKLLYEAMPELIIVVPLASIVGIIIFAWPYSKPGPESWW